MITKQIPMLKNLDNATKLKPFRERYFVNAAGESEFKFLQTHKDQYYLKHTNGVIVFGITKEHEAFSKQGVRVKSVNFNFQAGDKSNFIGKRKRNALFVKNNTRICDIEMEDGSIYGVDCHLKGKAIDFNDAFESNPNLILDDHSGTGYIAIFIQ